MTIEVDEAKGLALAAESDRAIDWLARLLAFGLLALVAATWKLWTPQTVFPQVTLFQAACDSPSWCDWICLATLVIASVALLIVGRRGIPSRLASSGIAISLAAFFVLDQHRLQPWAWQIFLLTVLLAFADDSTTRRGWFWLTVSIYFWSAISKVDYSFFHDQGPALIEGLKHAIGVRASAHRWSDSLDVWAALGLAVGELSVAIMLAFRRTRSVGVWLAILMHASLLLALGPLGLKHSSGVLTWNLFFACQTWLLFRENYHSDITTKAPDLDDRSFRTRSGNHIAAGTVLTAIIWPTLEPIDGCDHWLAWAVYSARAGQMELLVQSDEPPDSAHLEYDQVVRKINGESGVYHRPNVAAWSLRELGVPIYPQFRFYLAVGKDLQSRAPSDQVQVVRWRRDRWSGKLIGEQVVNLPNSDESNLLFWNTKPRWGNRD